MTVLELMPLLRGYVENGGDPNPCEIGTYCLRCCCAMTVMHEALPLENDSLITETVKVFRSFGDVGIKHTKESALELIDRVERNLKEK